MCVLVPLSSLIDLVHSSSHLAIMTCLWLSSSSSAPNAIAILIIHQADAACGLQWVLLQITDLG